MDLVQFGINVVAGLFDLLLNFLFSISSLVMFFINGLTDIAVYIVEISPVFIIVFRMVPGPVWSLFLFSVSGVMLFKVFTKTWGA